MDWKEHAFKEHAKMDYLVGLILKLEGREGDRNRIVELLEEAAKATA